MCQKIKKPLKINYHLGMIQQENASHAQNLFILRRAFRSPERSVTRAHLKAAFPLKDGAATARLNDCVDRYPSKLQRIGNRISPVMGAQAPEEAGTMDLLLSLSNNVTDFSVIGLTEKELPFRCRKNTETFPKKEIAAQAVVNAIVREESILIRYVTMRRGDQGKWRRIFPLGIEKVGDQLRVDAQDMSQPNSPVRSFVMTRIVDAQDDLESLPRGFLKSGFGDNTQEIAVKFSTKLTEVQKEVLAHEFNIRYGKIKILQRAIFEFKQNHSGSPIGEDVVHPIFESIGSPP